MEKNYYCNGVCFYSYNQARMYADSVLKEEGKYFVVMTKAEVDSITQAIDKAIDHEMECGK